MCTSQTALRMCTYVNKVIGTQVYGSQCDVPFDPPFYYPTAAFDSKSNRGESNQLVLRFTDREQCGDVGDDRFGYGLYEISIDGHSVQVDFRDGDYLRKAGGTTYGPGYSNCDIKIYYDDSNGSYYWDTEFAQPIHSAATVWERLKDDQPPRFPFIVRCNAGRVIIDDTLQAGIEQDPSIELGYLISDI